MVSNWSVYVVECSDKTLYTGVTNNISRRLLVHNSGKGARYTRGRGPVKLLCTRDGLSKSEAFQLEYKFKKLPRKVKLFWINSTIPYDVRYPMKKDGNSKTQSRKSKTFKEEIKTGDKSDAPKINDKSGKIIKRGSGLPCCKCQQARKTK